MTVQSLFSDTLNVLHFWGTDLLIFSSHYEKNEHWRNNCWSFCDQKIKKYILFFKNKKIESDFGLSGKAEVTELVGL